MGSEQLRLRDGDEPLAEADQKSSEGASASGSTSREESRLMAQYMAQRLKNGDPSEAPLLTEAHRLLERAKNEKVYSWCIVKIRYEQPKVWIA